jgi:hypothetical protein
MTTRQEQEERERIIQHDQITPGDEQMIQADRISQPDDRIQADRISQREDRANHPGLLNDPMGLREEWQRVQGTFVDDPQRAVHEASVLVDRTLQEIHSNVARGQGGEPTSTEDLRVSFQHYREFFQRLLSA